LQEAAELRMVSDVPVGVFLSGGIDSSALVALLSHAGHKLHTFSIGFSERAWDESEHSRLVARTFGTEHTELCLRPTDILPDIPEAMAAYDQPSIDGLNTYYIARATRRAGVKVALSGLGGDELFAGYPYFGLVARLERRLARGFARGVHVALRWFAPRSSRTTKLGQLLSARHSRLARYLACRLVMARPQRLALMGRPGITDEPLPPEVPEQLGATAENLDAINAQSWLELSLYLANMLLRDTDQMSMAHALEVREPLLDQALVETTAALPGALKLRGGPRSRIKALLVESLPMPLPQSILDRPKWGFILPWEHWIRQELRPYFHELLGSSAAIQAAGLRSPAVIDVWEGFLAGRPGLRASDVLAIANLVSWVRQHRLAPPADPAARSAVTPSAACAADRVLS
jgi:asparagine synthase (glutamine-hydrolysing)